MTDDADLTSLLASRICHDLVSPVGAIVNGADLIREIGGGDVQDEVALISQSAERASVLLQFYRIAFGAADDDATLSRAAIRTQADQMLATPRIGLDWEGMQGPPLTRAEGRLLFQILMCARAITGMRGQIAVRLDMEAGFPMSITVLPMGAVGAGPGAASVNQDALRLLATEPGRGEVGARHVEFALVHRTARMIGASLSVSSDGERALIRATGG